MTFPPISYRGLTMSMTATSVTPCRTARQTQPRKENTCGRFQTQRWQASPYYLFDFYFRGQRYQGSTRFVNKAAAKRFEANLINRLAKTRAGIVDVEPPPFFLFFAAQFLETVRNALRPGSVRGYRTSLATLAPFHKKRLDEISATEIEAVRRKRLEAGRSRPTVNRDLAFLRLTLAAAVRQHLIPTTPFQQRKVKFLKEHGRERILNFEEERGYTGCSLRSLCGTLPR